MEPVTCSKAESTSSPVFPVTLGDAQKITVLVSTNNSGLAALKSSSGQMETKPISLIEPIASKPFLVYPFCTSP